uniref:coiled-coil domain-containing protein n=1 Tax=Parolsenella massiliensis TaxID=1871022 RepID=UPI0012FEA2C0|nr:CHAP domain-containing protein [Parolsenella massiliensis]
MSRTPDRSHKGDSIAPSGLMTRRAALKAMLGITAVTAGLVSSPLRALAAEASRETTEALNSAQAQLDEAQKKLDAISDEFVSLNEQLNDTVSQIEQVQASIDDTQSQIEAKQADIADKQDVLASRISSSYKTGNADFLSLILNASSFEELSNNLFYLGKINASDEQLINDVKQAKAELDAQKAQLESQKADLEQLKEQQSQELAAVQAKQDEASAVVANLSDDVRALMEKRDAEVLAAAEEEKRQAAAAEAARKAAAASASSGSSGVSGTISSGNASSKGQAIVNACYQVGSPGSGLCAMWVSQVYSRAGYGYPGGNANNMYWNYCTSSNKGDLQPGMIIAVSTWTGTSAGRIYGHVGIYIGGGMVMHNVGSIQTMGLDAWINTYGTTVTPRWGWAA